MRKLCGEARAAPEAATSLLILVCSPRPLFFQNSLREREGHQPRDPTGPRDRRQPQDDVLARRKPCPKPTKTSLSPSTKRPCSKARSKRPSGFTLFPPIASTIR